MWIFSCTTSVSTTTTNTVVVAGSPTDDIGVALCGPSPLSALRVAPACDVTGNASAVVAVPLPGSITVTKRADPATTTTFSFLFGVTPFTLTDGGTRTFDGLTAGTYSVTELVPDGWQLASASCTDEQLGEFDHACCR